MVVADAGDFSNVLGHSQFTIKNHTEVTHSNNRLFQAAARTTTTPFCLPTLMAKVSWGCNLPGFGVHDVSVLHDLHFAVNKGKSSMTFPIYLLWCDS